MNKIFLSVLLMATTITMHSQAQTKSKTAAKKTIVKSNATVEQVSAPLVDTWKQLNSTERLLEITTDYGIMIAKLYDSTPLHRDNFIRLVQEKFYDSLLFHRVINQFMIQGGDPTSKNAPEGMQLGSGSAPGERIPAEFKPSLFHKKGVLAAARDNNPQKASSNCQFYIVQGKPIPEQELNNKNMYTAGQKEIYSKIGGTPFLDQSYSVFGEVISGLDVIDRIANQPKDGSDRPTKNITMKIRLLN